MDFLELAKAINPIPFWLAEGVQKGVKEIDSASEKGIVDLRSEVAKQELRGNFDLQQAKIAQEIAIAHRITYAETVEIEEFYDRSGSGDAGLGLSDSGLNLGLKGEGKSVVKRIYKFMGHTVPEMDAIADGCLSVDKNADNAGEKSTETVA